jgi:hypothetical protein
MVVTQTPEIEGTLEEMARRHGMSVEDLVRSVLREWVERSAKGNRSADDWVSLILSAGTDCGVSLPDSALSSDAFFDDSPLS